MCVVAVSWAISSKLPEESSKLDRVPSTEVTSPVNASKFAWMARMALSKFIPGFSR
jgi:hypothetical protein